MFLHDIGERYLFCNQDSAEAKRENSKGQGSTGPLFLPEKNRQWILLPRPELSVPCVKHNAKEEYPRGADLDRRRE